MPSLVLHKGIIRAQIHGHGGTAHRAAGHQFRRNFHLLLPGNHFFHRCFVVIGLLAAGPGTLKQPVISLGIEKPLFVKAGLLKLMIHVGGNHKIVLVFYQLQKIVINAFRSAHVTIYIDIPAPVGPKFFRRFVRVKAAGIHIVKPVCLLEIRKIPSETLALIDKSRRSGQACAGADHNAVSMLYGCLQPVQRAGAIFGRSCSQPL